MGPHKKRKQRENEGNEHFFPERLIKQKRAGSKKRPSLFQLSPV